MDRFFDQHERPRRPHLVVGKSGVAGEVDDLRHDVADAFARVEEYVGTGSGLATTGIAHYWANGDTGDDDNDGLSEATPKKTIAAAAELIPSHIKHVTVLNLRGTFDDGYVPFKRIMEDDRLLIDGGPEVDVVAGPYVADIGGTTTVGLSTLSLALKEWDGYWIHFLDGPNAGLRYSVNKNDTTTALGNRPWSDPTGSTFQIERPATTFTSTGFSGLQLRFIGDGQVNLSRMRFAGVNTFFQIVGGSANVNMCVFEQAGGSGIFFQRCSSTSLGFVTGGVVSDPDTGYAIDSTYRTGVSFRTPNVPIEILQSLAMQMSGSQFYCKKMTINGLSSYRIRRGVRFIGNTFIVGCRCYSPTFPNFLIDSGYPPISFEEAADGDGNGLTVIDSSVLVVGGSSTSDLDLSNNAGHGLELRAGSIFAVDSKAGLVGSGNVKAGAYVNSGSQLLLQEGGDKPTVNGVVGDLAISDPVVEEANWTDVYDNDIPASVLNELSLAKKQAGAF